MRAWLWIALSTSSMFIASRVNAQDIAPPPPINVSGPTTTTTTTELDKSEKEDSGRNFELIYANAEAGFSYLNMTQFSESQLGLTKTTSTGPMIGAGAGVRLLIFTLGVRVRLEELSSFNLWDLNGELGFHIPVGKADPYLSIHGGYASVGSFDTSAVGTVPSTSGSSSTTPSVGVHGFDAGISLGFDYYVTTFLSLGIDATGDLLFLQRPPIAKPAGFSSLPAADQMAVNTNPLYANSGDSVGFGFAGSAHLGLHFGL